MDFELTEDQKMIQSLVRQFVDDELMPMEKEIMSTNYAGIGRRRMLSPETENRLQQKAKDIGLWALFVPQEYGGEGLGVVEFCIVNEEINRTLVPLDFGGDAPSILLADKDNEELMENYYLACVRGEKRFCLALSEPNAGADPAGMQTTATKNGDKWLLNGTKMWCTDGESADYALMFAITDKEAHAEKRTQGISLFVVDRSVDSKPGYKVGRMIDTIAEYSVTELILEDTPGMMVGEQGKGFLYAQRVLDHGARLHHAARDLGMAGRALEMSRDYAQQRVTFGQPIATRQAVQWMLADSATEMFATRCMMLNCAHKAERGVRFHEEAAMVKYYADEMINRVLDRAIQIHGGMGLSADLPLEKLYRRARIWKIAGGPMEMMKIIISRGVLKGFMP